MDAMKIANSIPMWIACGIPVILVIAQALIFAKKSYSAGKKIGLTEKQMKNAIKSSAITSIGPSIVILVTMISLIVSMGAPVSWYCQMGKNHHVIRYHYMFWTGTCYLSCIRI